MINPFKVYALAADARLADRILADHFPHCDTLAEKAEVALNRIDWGDQFSTAATGRIAELEAELAAANAKINRMTSGLKRGSTPKRGSKVSA